MARLSVEARRGQHVESTHEIAVAIANHGGRRIAFCGNPDRPTFFRSATKPFQALPLVADGAADGFALSDAELALACASHSSEVHQVELVRQWLGRIGCKESDLVCGPHRPLSLDLTMRPPGDPGPSDTRPRGGVFSNCSGKHVGMLTLALHHGWSIEGYEQVDHPVQRRCKEEVSRWTGTPIDQIGEAVDGCGVVCFQTPLDAMAAGFARLGVSDQHSAVRVRRAMMAHPELVAGQHRLCTALMQAYPSGIIAKVGAAGVYGVALPKRGLGIALKVEDGDARAAMVALLAVLEALDLDPRPSDVLPRFATIPVHNTRAEQVGEIRATGALTFA